MIGIQRLKQELDALAIVQVMGEAIPDRGIFESHRVVHDMALKCPVVLPAGVRKILIERQPIKALLTNGLGKVEEPGFTAALVEPVDAQSKLGTAQHSPRSQRVLCEQSPQFLHTARYGRKDAVIARSLLVLGQRLEEHKDRPGIVGIAIVRILQRAQPAIGLLVLEDSCDPTLCLLSQPFVLQEKSQGNQAIQPVGAALPSLALSSNPRALSKIRPELIKVTG